MPAASLIPFTPELRPSLAPISGSKDYAQWREQLERMDSFLPTVARRLIQVLLESWLKANPEASPQKQERFERTVLSARG